MSRDVKSSSYDSSGRRASSAANRQRIIDTARQLILTKGYRATTMSAIATTAGISVDTVYELVGRKPLLLRTLIEQALSGTDQTVDAEQRDHVVAMRAEPDPEIKLAIYARAITETHRRLAPLFLALRDASSTETEAREVWDEVSRRRAANMRKLALDLRSTGRLRSDLSIDDAADIIWATNSPELYVLLTDERGWPPDRYQQWLADGWVRLLLE